MKVLGFKRLALAVAASITFALFAAQFAQSDRCSDYRISMCNYDCAGVKPFYPCFKECMRSQTCPPAAAAAAAAVGTGLLDSPIPGSAHKSTAFTSDPMKLKD